MMNHQHWITLLQMMSLNTLTPATHWEIGPIINSIKVPITAPVGFHPGLFRMHKVQAQYYYYKISIFITGSILSLQNFKQLTFHLIALHSN